MRLSINFNVAPYDLDSLPGESPPDFVRDLIIN